MNVVYQFFRKNIILAVCEDCLCYKSFTLNLSRFEMTEVPELVSKCESLMKLFLHHNQLKTVRIILIANQPT